MKIECAKCGTAWEAEPCEHETPTVRCGTCSEEIDVTGLLGRVRAPERPESREGLPVEVQAAAADASNRFGRFVRVSLLGRGGMGEVWKAWDTDLGRWLALKFPRIEEGEDLERFRREAEAAARVSHPNIATVLEFGRGQGRHYLAMQFVDGEALDRYPREDRKKLVGFVYEAAVAVAHAHAQGFVHRDLKPANLMVDRRGDRVYVMDFGLARRVEGGRTTTTVVGTPNFMSPEQARGERATPRSDVWSLGATLYDLLADRPPFEGPTALEILRRVNEEDPKPLRHVDRDLNTIVMKCLEKDPARRYQSALELAEDLRRWMNDEPILARAPSLGYLLGRWARRHKAAVALIALTVAGVCGGVGFGFRQLMEAKEASDKAKKEAEEKVRQRKLSVLQLKLHVARQGFYIEPQDPVRVRRELRIAIDEVTQFIKENPGYVQAYHVRARGRLYLNDLDAAERDLRAALELKPDFLPATDLLARVYAEKAVSRVYGSPYDTNKLKHQARKYLKAARELRSRESRKTAEEWGLVTSRDDEVSRVILVAMGNALEDKWAEARKVLTNANSRNPSEEYLNWLGLWNERLQDGRRGEEYLRENIHLQSEALKWRPHFAKALFDRGVAYRDMGDAEAKKGLLRRACVDWYRAIEDFLRAAEVHPNYELAYSNASLAWDEIVKAMNVGLQNPSDYYELGRIHLELREYEDATKNFIKSHVIGRLWKWSGRIKALTDCSFAYGAWARAVIEVQQPKWKEGFDLLQRQLRCLERARQLAEQARARSQSGMPLRVDLDKKISICNFNLACCLDRLSEITGGADREGLLDRAIECLRTAGQLGLFSSPGQRKNARLNSHLETVRKRRSKEFREIVGQ